MAVLSGGAGAVPQYGIWISAGIDFLYTAQKTWKDGGDFKESLYSGTVSGISSIISIGNLAGWNDVVLSTFETSIIDLSFGTGANLVVACGEELITNNIYTQKSRSKCTVSDNGCSTDYFKYLYNGGKPF